MDELKTNKLKSSYGVPYWATSFEQLDNIQAANQIENALYELLFNYTDLVTNVLQYGNFVPVDFASFKYDSTYAVDQIKAITLELTQRLNKIPALGLLKEEKEKLLKENVAVRWSVLNKSGDIEMQPSGVITEILTEGKFGHIVASADIPVYKIKNDETGEFLYKHSGQLQVSDTLTKSVASNNAFTLYKDANGDLRWTGIVTNIYQDVAKDILTKDAHIKFIEKLEKNLAEYPELWIWHIEKPVGQADWVGYDDRGFVIVTGTVEKEYEDLVTNLVKNTPEMGMSHGMPIESVVYSQGRIVEYISKEYSLLPVSAAANKLTYYIIGEKDDNETK